MPFGTEVSLGPGPGTQLPRKRGRATPLFSAHVYCGHGRPSQLLLSSCYINHDDIKLLTMNAVILMLSLVSG